jgi:hypothetical protein
MRHVWLVADAAAATPCCREDRVIRALGDLEGLGL